MRVLQFAPRTCWPLDTGAKLRNYHLARVLAERASVTLLALSDKDLPSIPEQTPYAQVVSVTRDASYTFSKVMRGAVGPTPLPVLNYTTERMKRTLVRILNEQEFDIVQFESIHLMAYLPIICAAPKRPLKVCDWHNIESELMRRYGERESSPLRRAYARRTARLMNSLERKASNDFDAHIVVSERDAERLRALNAQARIFVIENGVDTAYYSDDQFQNADRTGAKRANRIVFVGSMDYHANIDGVLSFAREVWPRVRERQPDLVFTIVGRDPPPAVRELARMPGIEITGTVADVRPYYREAIAAVVPLNIGGGSRLKILEAMAAGIPVVSTTLGAEGLQVRSGENILIADQKEQLVAAILSVVENESQRRDLQAGGRALISDHYDWSKLGLSLFAAYQELLAMR